MTTGKYTMIDLFAGCGGLSLGMENAGFEPVYASELNKDAMDSYLANRPDLRARKNYCFDIETLVANNAKGLKTLKHRLLKEGLLQKEGRNTSLDLVCGGPPCQGFSGIGHRRSYGVDKKDLPSNQLFHKMLTVVKEFQPKLFLFENVKGLLSAKWTRADTQPNIWKQVFETYTEELSNYTVRWELVRAKDYGVPQNRPRVLMVGIRKDVLKKAGLPSTRQEASTYDKASAVLHGLLPSPQKGNYPHPKELLEDLLDPEISEYLENVRLGKGPYPDTFDTKDYPSAYDPKSKIHRYFRRQNGKKHKELTQQTYSKHKRTVLEKFYAMQHPDKGVKRGTIPEAKRTKKFAQRLLDPMWPEDGPNITATSLPDDYVHYSQPRILTVREWARLQMFPDWYEFKGKRTTGGLRRAGNPQEGIHYREVPMYTQIGNAVPVALAEAVGTHFVSILG